VIKKALTITQAAANRIKELISMKPEPDKICGVKVGVRRRGCNSYNYVMSNSEQGEVGKLDELVCDCPHQWMCLSPCWIFSSYTALPFLPKIHESNGQVTLCNYFIMLTLYLYLLSSFAVSLCFFYLGVDGGQKPIMFVIERSTYLKR
jgi:hypothetical protein